MILPDLRRLYLIDHSITLLIVGILYTNPILISITLSYLLYVYVNYINEKTWYVSGRCYSKIHNSSLYFTLIGYKQYQCGSTILLSRLDEETIKTSHLKIKCLTPNICIAK